MHKYEAGLLPGLSCILRLSTVADSCLLEISVQERVPDSVLAHATESSQMGEQAGPMFIWQDL